MLPPVQASGLFGPGKFVITQLEDRFSTAPTITFMGQNNRISKKSPVGGIYIGGDGLFLEPLVVRNRANEEIIRVGFFFHNDTEIDTTYGSPNSLGIPQKISFIVDGSKKIVTSVVKGGAEVGEGIQYNSVGRYASSSVTETGLIYVSIEDMAAIANAKSIAIKVEGSKRIVTYNEKDIAKAFIPNLAAFYTQKIVR